MENFFNPFNRHHISLCDQMIQQLLDFDPEIDKINSLMNTLLSKFEYFVSLIYVPIINFTSSNTSSFVSLQLSQYILLFENLHTLSKYFSPWKIGNLGWVVLRENCVPIIKSLEIIQEV